MGDGRYSTEVDDIYTRSVKCADSLEVYYRVMKQASSSAGYNDIIIQREPGDFN